MRTILFFLLLFLIISCDKQDPKQPEQHNKLYGSWYLVRFEGAIFHPPYEYTDEIKWTFNNDSIEVLIANGTDVSPLMPLGNNGTYSYYLFNNNNYNYINIAFSNNISQNYRYEITNDTLFLYLGELETDGNITTLIKTN